MSRKIKIKKGIISFRYILSYLLLAFYLIIAFLFLFTDTWIDLIPEKRAWIGLFFLAFAALRFYVSHKRFKGKRAKLEEKLNNQKEKLAEDI